MVALRRGLVAVGLALCVGSVLALRTLHAQAPQQFSDSPYALPPSSSSGGISPLPPMVPLTATAPTYGAAPAASAYAQPSNVPALASRSPAPTANDLPAPNPQYNPSSSPPAGQAAAPPQQSAPQSYSTPNSNLPSYTAPQMQLPDPATGSYSAGGAAKKGETVVTEVRVEGNHTTPMAKMPKLSTRVGQPFDPHLVEEDVRALASSRKFLDVKSQFQSVPGGIVIIFQVVERPTLEYVKFVGNQDVRTQTLRKKSELEKGQPLDPYAVEEGRRRVESYYHEKGYNHIQISTIEGDKPNDRGAVFMVDEGQNQKVWWVDFEGNTIASDSRLRTQIQVKPGVMWLFGGKVDRKKIDDDQQKLYAYYRGLGFFKAKISPDLSYDDAQHWLTLKYIIDEGPRFSIRNVSFNGNEKFKNDELNKGLEQISGKPFNQTTLDHDLAAIRDVYGTHGYIFSDVQAETRLLEDKPEMDLIYNVAEGKRYRVGKINVNIGGDEPHTKHSTIYNRLSLHPGDIVDTKKIRDDERRLRASALFNVDPSKGGAPKIAFSKQDEKLDDNQTSVAQRPTTDPNSRARNSRIGTPFNSSQGYGNGPATPGGPSSPGGYGSGYGSSGFSSGGYEGYRGQSPDDDEVLVDVTCAKDSSGNDVIVFTPSQDPTGRITDPAVEQARFQSPGSDWNATGSPGYDDARAAWGVPSGSSTPSYLPSGAQPRAPSNVTAPLSSAAAPSSYPTNSYPPAAYPPAANAQYQPQNVPSSGGLAPIPPAGTTAVAPPVYNPPAAQQPNPYPPAVVSNGGNAFGPGYGAASSPPAPYYTPGVAPTPQPGFTPVAQVAPPVYSQPLPPPGGPGYSVVPVDQDPSVDLNVSATETMTGRLQIGAGINSDAGLVGNFILDEQNFDIARLPRSWDDIADGKAWRGGGQQFRLEADPGTQLQRYAATFRDPYIFDTNVQFSISAYYFTRIYDNWTEGRVGGTTSLGYAFSPDLKGTIGFRGEQVQIYNPIPTDPNLQPPQLKDVLGHNELYGFSAGMSHDTRDSPFLPTQGHLVSATFEEVIGTFQYPRVDLQAQQYFLLHQRADGSGRHVIGLGGQFDVTGADTPIYDTYYAGGFSTLRGFAFRGVTPRVRQTFQPPTVPPNPPPPVQIGPPVEVGGDFMMIGTAEYLFPITADDALRGVVFCDFGTVEDHAVTINNFRVSPGFGLRISIPAMGPAPIALDLAFPINPAQGDQIQNFSFFVGLGR